MDRPSRLRSRVKFSHVIAGLVGATLAVAPVTAYAVLTDPPGFSDVPPSHTFYDEILWADETGVANGYPGDIFKPNAYVTRAQMTAFLQRLYNLQAGLTAIKTGANGPSADDDTATWTNVDSLTVEVPSGTSTQILATFSGEALCNAGDNIFAILFAIRPNCQARLVINGSVASPGVVTVMDSDDGAVDPDVAIDAEGFSFQGVSTTLSGGVYTVTAQINTADESGNTDDETVFDVSEYLLSAQVLLNDTAP